MVEIVTKNPSYLFWIINKLVLHFKHELFWDIFLISVGVLVYCLPYAFGTINIFP